MKSAAMPNLPVEPSLEQTLKKAKSSTAAPQLTRFITVLLVFIASFILGFGVSKEPQVKIISNPATPTPPPTVNLPISSEILQSSALSEWSLSVAGKVTEKNEDSFTLLQISRQYDPQGFLIISEVKNGKTLTIRNVDGQTFFRMTHGALLTPSGVASSGGQVSLSDLPLGKVVTGIVKVRNENANLELIGGNFSVIR